MAMEESSQHPHYLHPALPPEGWLSRSQVGGGSPTLIPSIEPVGEPEYVEIEFAELSIENALRHFLGQSAFPVASSNFEDEEDTDYGHLFIRDAALGLMMLDGTHWPTTLGRPNIIRDFLKEAYRYQGQQDVPNARVPGANDGEKAGRLPHEIWFNWKDSAVARKYNEDRGWTWPIYFGAVDTTPLIAMMTAKVAKKILTAEEAQEIGSQSRSSIPFLLEGIEQEDNRGTKRTTSVLEAYLAAVSHVVRESRITDINPEGIYETTMMSNLCWGDWDDSYDVIRTQDGRPAEGRVAHTQLQAFARSSMLGLIEVLDTMEQQHKDGLLSFAEYERAHEILNTFFEGQPDFLGEVRQTADRLGAALTEHFLIRDDPKYGTYFALGTDRDPDTNELRPLDVCSAKPGLINLVEPQHLPEGVAAIALTQVFDPDEGILTPNGASNVSDKDDFFGAEVYHGGANWPDKNELYALGAQTQGAEGLANEMRQCNWANFIHGYVRGFFEFLKANKTGEPLPIQRDFLVRVKNSDPAWEYRYYKHAMFGQFWAVCASARAQDQLFLAWGGKAPARATNPKLSDRESALMSKIQKAQGLRTASMYNRDDPHFFKENTIDGKVRLANGDTIEVTEVAGASEPLLGQRMPGDYAKGRAVSGSLPN